MTVLLVVVAQCQDYEQYGECNNERKYDHSLICKEDKYSGCPCFSYYDYDCNKLLAHISWSQGTFETCDKL